MARTRTFHTRIYTIDISPTYISCAIKIDFTLFVSTSVLARCWGERTSPLFTNCHSSRIYRLTRIENYISLRSRTCIRRRLAGISNSTQKSRTRYACDVFSIDCPLSHEFERGNLRRIFDEREPISVFPP